MYCRVEPPQFQNNKVASVIQWQTVMPMMFTVSSLEVFSLILVGEDCTCCEELAITAEWPVYLGLSITFSVLSFAPALKTSQSQANCDGWLITPSGSHDVPEPIPSYLHTEEWVCHTALSWLIFLSKCRSELKRYKPDLEPGHCMVELVMPSTWASRLKEGGHHSHCKCCMFIWQFFSVVKSLITTKSLYYDNSLTDGITVIEEGSLFLIDTYMPCGLVAALEATCLVRCLRGISVSHSVKTREDEEAIN